MSNEKAKPSAPIVIAAVVIIIVVVFFYASGQLKAQQRADHLPITTQTPLSGSGEESSDEESGQKEDSSIWNEGENIGNVENNVENIGGGNTTIQNPENNGPSINEAFEDILWQGK